MNLKMKRKILSTLLNVMYAHRHDTVVVRNSCLILCQFELPHDVKFEYEKLVKILLFIISEHTSEDGAFVQRASICLLNSLACQVEGKQKLLVGDLGAMEKMLDVIKSKLQSGMFLCCYIIGFLSVKSDWIILSDSTIHRYFMSSQQAIEF